MTANDLQQWQATILAKALQDAAFKQSLLADPRAAIERELKLPIPPDVKFQAVEAPANTLLVVLPYVPATKSDGEMSDADLESVAGGSKSGAVNFFNTVNNATIGDVIGKH